MVLKANSEDQSVVLGPVVQSIISLTSFSVVKMLIVLVSTISNSHIFLLKKCEQLLQMQKLLTFFQQKKSSIYAIFNDQSFNDTLTNDIVSFEQLGPGSISSYGIFSYGTAHIETTCALMRHQNTNLSTLLSAVYSWLSQLNTLYSNYKHNNSYHVKTCLLGYVDLERLRGAGRSDHYDQSLRCLLTDSLIVPDKGCLGNYYTTSL